MPAETGTAKVSLFTECDALRSRLGWAAADHAWWIPGRLEVFGKHTDYGADGRWWCLAARSRDARWQRALLGCRRSNSGRTDRRDCRVSCPRGRGTASRWAIYADTVVRRLSRNFPGAGFQRTSSSPATCRPQRMSSSSALIVGLAAPLVRLAGLESRDGGRGTSTNRSTGRRTTPV